MVNSYELYSQITKPLVPRQSNPFTGRFTISDSPGKALFKILDIFKILAVWMDPLILTENPKPSLIRLKST